VTPVRSALRIKEVRETRDLHELLPPNSEVFINEFTDILSRMATGYWPTIQVPEGWYGVVASLHVALAEMSPGYQVVAIKKENDELFYLIRIPDNSHDMTSEMLSAISIARGRCRVLCEICGEPGDSILVCNNQEVRCTNHSK